MPIKFFRATQTSQLRIIYFLKYLTASIKVRKMLHRIIVPPKTKVRS